jgi:hypothetical protein
MAGDKEHQRPRHQQRDQAGDPEQAECGCPPEQAEPRLVADQRHRDPQHDGDEYGDPDHLDAPPMNPGEERRGPPYASRIRTVSHGSATSTNRLRPRNRNGLTASAGFSISVMISPAQSGLPTAGGTIPQEGNKI